MKPYRLLKKEECEVTSPFWKRYFQLVREKVIPYQWEVLNDNQPDAEPSRAIENFRIAAGEKEGSFYGMVFQDSDVSKWLEAVGNTLMLGRDEALEAQADSVIDIIERAQQEDGYLDTYFIIQEPTKKWNNLLDCHELYCAGHFIEGAIAYYQATGKEKVLKIAIRLADHIFSVFGPEDGKLHGYPGHQEIELALLRLKDVTGDEKYQRLAQYFLDTRGTNHFFEEELEKRKHIYYWNGEKADHPNHWYTHFPYAYYNQFHLPVREQKKAVGHAVRAVYMYTAMADLASRIPDDKLWQACRDLWENIVTRQMYLTGAIGATHTGESFTVDYDLPNDTVYGETCASIGLMFFAQKMLKNDVDRSYGDVMEQALYNTVLGGMNYEGNRFFYVNPLESVPESCVGNTERNHVKPTRQKWFACACCPPNIARLIAGLWQYFYTADANTVYVHLYGESEGSIQLEQGLFHITQETEYPWDGHVRMTGRMEGEGQATLAFRLPGWSIHPDIRIQGVDCRQVKAFTLEEKKGYLYVTGCWQENVEIDVDFHMVPRLMEANQKVHYDGGKGAIIRGPLVYCLEEADNGKYLSQLVLDSDFPFSEVKTGTPWEGSVLIQTRGYRQMPSKEQGLYHPYTSRREPVMLKAIPYFLWNNRGEGEMQVWIPVR